MAKIGETEAIRIYGPYPDERDATKWTIHIFPAGADKPIIIPTFGFDLSRVYDTVRELLFTKIVTRDK